MHGLFHVHHGGGEERGKTDNASGIGLDRVGEFLGGHVDSEVHHFPSASLDHHGHEILADVVQVAGNRSDDETALVPDRAALEIRLQVGHGRVHGLGGHEQVRNENLVLREFFADARHAGHAALEYVVRGLARGQGVPRDFVRAFLAAEVRGIGGRLVDFAALDAHSECFGQFTHVCSRCGFSLYGFYGYPGLKSGATESSPGPLKAVRRNRKQSGATESGSP